MARTALVLALASLAGLPPLFFFYPKLAVLAVVILQNPWHVSVLALALIALGWFIYLNALRAFGGQCWSFAGETARGSRATSTGLANLLLLLLLLLLLGFFFLPDALLAAVWLFS